ncbi:hypothetical protein FSP39_005039 [Pinctada imbricata]|uniref:Carboxylic ester hydrolase n=1 Tax=Pinctada imbricata TaxID=66713 RepID=A0AA88YHQ8_PINIB|nr:hypothetical protein FSP39_005039 [Pinctada imbricata]
MINYLIVFTLLTGLALSEDAHVQTPLGPIKGLELIDKESGAKIYQFRGIRFAKAPTGDLRFSKPVAVDPWTEEYDATEFGDACPQTVMEMLNDGSERQSEDCLNLNVYVPKTLDKNEKLSVMVWIHGGGLLVGNGFSYDGTRMAIDGNVVVVTFNYRVGNLGFMSLFHSACRGNFGLWDQILALKWVQNNIASFRGDPNSVTIFGESAGGWSVSYQTLIPSNKGLFKRAIAQSGVASRYSVQRRKHAEETVHGLSEKTKCPMGDSTKFIDCLRKASVESLLNDDLLSMSEDKVDPEYTIGPVVDGELFPAHPIELLEDPNSPQSIFFGSIDFVAGATSQEGLVHFAIMPKAQELYNFNITEGITSEFVHKGMIKPFVDAHFDGNTEIEEKMKNFYLTDASLADQANMAAEFFGDMFFTPYVADKLKHHARMKNGKTYQYQVSKPMPAVFGDFGGHPSWFKGCGHGEELVHLFYSDTPINNKGTAMFNITLTDEEKVLSKKMIRYWSSFAKTGIPSAGDDSLPWLEYDSERKIYMDFDLDLSLRQNWKSDQVKLWTEDFPPIRTDPPFQHDEL